MRRFKKYRLGLLLFLAACSVMVKTVAQVGIAVVAGQQRNLAVIQQPGEVYAWRIYNSPAMRTADLANSNQVVYDLTNSQATLPVLWKSKGIYYYSITVFSATGCKNMKVGVVSVSYPPVIALAQKDTTIGVCNSVFLDGSKSIGDSLSYRWKVLDSGGIINPDNEARVLLKLNPDYKGSLPVKIRVMLTVWNKYGAKGMDTVSVIINAPPLASIVYPDSPNKDGSMVIDATVSQGLDLKYKWSSNKGEIITDPEKPEVLIKGSGIYSLEVTDTYGCKSVKSFQYPFDLNDLYANADYVRTSWTDSIRINVLNNDYDAKRDLDISTLTILRKPIYGTAKVNSDGTINYSPTTHEANIDHLVYQICDLNKSCDTAQVTIDIFEGPVWIPEAISVNGDGANETFVIRGLEIYPNSSLTIYSRAGQLVYKSADYQNDWSGKAFNSTLQNGTLLPTGTYYYVLRLGGTDRFIKGFVYLLY